MSEICYIAHHGIKGMKWGVRRYQRKDGSRTSIGKKHQAKLDRSYDDAPNVTTRKNVIGKTVKAATYAVKSYNKVQEHGSDVLNKKAQRYQARSQRAASKGQKIRSSLYNRKSAKYQDKAYDDIESFYEGLKDVGAKAAAVYNVAAIGSSIVKNVIVNYGETRIRDIANAEILKTFN